VPEGNIRAGVAEALPGPQGASGIGENRCTG